MFTTAILADVNTDSSVSLWNIMLVLVCIALIVFIIRNVRR